MKSASQLCNVYRVLAEELLAESEKGASGARVEHFSVNYETKRCRIWSKVRVNSRTALFCSQAQISETPSTPGQKRADSAGERGEEGSPNGEGGGPGSSAAQQGSLAAILAAADLYEKCVACSKLSRDSRLEGLSCFGVVH